MRGLLLGCALALIATPALAGPPYNADDPEPTDTGHWEIYNFIALDGRQGEVDGAAGVDLNYGAVKDVQLTATLPVGFERLAGNPHLRIGRGDVELAVKARLVHREKAGFQLAIFPRVILPTAAREFGTGRVRLLLPVWAQQDFGKWSLFGGGGYLINPGPGNRNQWHAGIALIREVSRTVSFGIEATHDAPDADDTRPATTLGAGGIVKLGGPYALLVSAGPTFEPGHTGYHAYTALGVAF